GGDWGPMERGHRRYRSVLDDVRGLVPSGVKVQVIDRSFLPQFTFDDGDIVVTVGPDGLVVNTAKYLNGQPILAVNPDPEQVEGVLLPFTIEEYPRALAAALHGDVRLQQITMAEAVLSDGQRIVAFNHLFISLPP